MSFVPSRTVTVRVTDRQPLRVGDQRHAVAAHPPVIELLRADWPQSASTALASGQAVKAAFASIRVTRALASAFLTVRAQFAPANPPPMTMIRGPRFWEIAGAAKRRRRGGGPIRT